MAIIKEKELQELVEILSEAESFRPIVRQAVDFVKAFCPEIREIPEAFCEWLVKNRIKHVEMYEKAGFSRDDAITMTLDDVFAARRAGDRFNAAAANAKKQS